ncbi:MAG TPA: MFS transporter [Actinospica sp.]|nr:MFS transporter [Actinospica sp.]
MTKKDRPKLPGAFHRVWLAATVSSLGDGVYGTALPLLALTLTRNPVIFGVMTAVTLLPWLLFGLIGGALVDRWDRRRTMVVTDLCRCVLLVVATIAIAGGFADIGLLIALGFLLGVGGMLFDTASSAFIPELMDRDPELLQAANSRLQGSQRAADGFIGLPIGSLLFTISRTVPFLADAVSFLFSSLMIRTLPARPKRETESKGSIIAAAREGASYMLHDKLLVGLAVRPAVGNLAFCACEAVLPLYARVTLHLSPAGFGTFLVTNAVGALAGTFVSGRLGRRLGTGGALTLTGFVEAAGLLTVGLAPDFLVAGAAFVVLGAAMAVTMTLGWSVRQSIVPDELMGRVAAATRLTALSAAPLGALLGGWFAHVAGLRAPFIAGAGVLVVMGFVAARLTSNSRVEAALAEAARASTAMPVGTAAESPA